jgi:hypothetical protein
LKQFFEQLILADSRQGLCVIMGTIDLILSHRSIFNPKYREQIDGQIESSLLQIITRFALVRAITFFNLNPLY